MRKWTAAADGRRGAGLPPVRYSDESTALPAALPAVSVVAPATTTKARVVSWPRVLALTLGVWSVSYLVRQTMTWGSADMPFSPLGSFALEGIALAIVAIGAVLGWSLVALAALRNVEHATPAAPAQYAVIVPYPVPDRTASRRDHRTARLGGGGPGLVGRAGPPPWPSPVPTGEGMCCPDGGGNTAAAVP